MRSHARRWARCCDEATWPEVLRRYLLASRANLPRPLPPALALDAACEGDGGDGGGAAAPDQAPLDDDGAAVLAAEQLDAKPFYR
jgi:hypothetical protein